MRKTKEQNSKYQTPKTNNGITLIVLVITIIILLILAGITINMVLGDDGLIKQATNAKAQTENTSKKENELIKEQEIEIEIYSNEKSATKWDGSVATGYAKGEGTEESPYEISNGSELAYLAQEVNNGNEFEGKVFKLTNDIDLQNKEWTPIGGTVSEEVKQFKGELDGNNNLIYNLTINQEDNSRIGLIGYLGEVGKVKNLVIASGNVKASRYVGGIAGVSKGTIEECRNYASITAVDNAEISATGEGAGGIVGRANGTIKKCINKGNVLTRNECGKAGRGKCAGGIVGAELNSNLEIIDCKNYGKVVSQYQLVGGIIGSYQSEGCNLNILRCENYGDVSTEPTNSSLSASSSGGIIGWMALGSVNIKECKNEGNINSLTSVGGIVGQGNAQTNISNCINQGKVTAELQQAGGIIGTMAGGLVTECSNKGYIKSNSIGVAGISGGIVGVQTTGKVEKCYNDGKISTGNYSTSTIEASGGITGLLIQDGVIEYCYSSSEFENAEASGEIVGKWNTSSTASVNSCYYTNETIKGIGSKGTNNSIITPADDEPGVTQKIDAINGFDNFKGWLKNNFPSLTFNIT